MEILDIYDNHGNITGKTVDRKDKTRKFEDNEHIAISIIFIENSKGEFLIQKISKQIGGIYSSTGGHVHTKETPKEAIIREVHEELGIDISNENIKELGYVIFDMPIRYIYYLKKDINTKDIIPQKEEVESASYLKVSEIKKLIQDNLFIESHGIIFEKILECKSKQ